VSKVKQFGRLSTIGSKNDQVKGLCSYFNRNNQHEKKTDLCRIIVKKWK